MLPPAELSGSGLAALAPQPLRDYSHQMDGFTPAFVTDDDPLAHELERAIRHDDGATAKARLAAGLPIYVADAATPKGYVTKVHPDGRRELVTFDTGAERRMTKAA